MNKHDIVITLEKHPTKDTNDDHVNGSLTVVWRDWDKILKNETDRLVMGNIDSERDWGHAEDYVEGMWRILQHDNPEDFVLSTGEKHTVREFIEEAFKLKDIEIAWKGENVNEIGYDKKTGKEYIFINEKYYRPAEVDLLIGDATKAKEMLGWEPKIKFKELVKRMVEFDCN